MSKTRPIGRSRPPDSRHHIGSLSASVRAIQRADSSQACRDLTHIEAPPPVSSVANSTSASSPARLLASPSDDSLLRNEGPKVNPRQHQSRSIAPASGVLLGPETGRLHVPVGDGLPPVCPTSDQFSLHVGRLSTPNGNLPSTSPLCLALRRQPCWSLVIGAGVLGSRAPGDAAAERGRCGRGGAVGGPPSRRGGAGRNRRVGGGRLGPRDRDPVAGCRR